MRVFRPQFPCQPLVTRVQPPVPVEKDPERHKPARKFRRFFQGPAPASHKGQRAGDLQIHATWSNLLATRRLIIQAELASIAEKPSDAEVPDYERRVARVSIAMYLVGMAGAIIRKTPSQVPYELWPPLLHVDELLETPFFTEAQHAVLFHYDEIKASLEAQGFHILNVDDAAKKYLSHVKTRVAQMRKRRQGPQHIDVKA